MKKLREKIGRDSNCFEMIRRLITIALVVLVLLIGYFSVRLIRPMLPDYRGEIVACDLAERNSPIYLQSDDRIRIYPWDEYDEDSVISLEEYVDILTDSAPSDEEDSENLRTDEIEYFANSYLYLKKNIDAEKIRKAWNAGFSDLCSELVPWCQLIPPDDAYSSFVYENNAVFLKDMMIQGNNGNYFAEAAFDLYDQSFYYHFYREEKPVLEDGDIREATDHLRESVDTLLRDPDFLFALCCDDQSEWIGYFYPEKDADPRLWDNPIIRAILRLRQNPWKDFGNTAAIYELILASNDHYDILVYQNEVLVVFAPGDGSKLVLYYDPSAGEISGISLDVRIYLK